jgi:flagellar biosynthesis protein FliR
MIAVDGWALVLALARVAPLVLVAPAAAGLSLPRAAQAALALAVAAVIAAGLDAPAAAIADASWAARAMLLARETLVGAVLGAVAAVPLAAASIAAAWAASAADDVAGGGTWSSLFSLTAAAVFFGLGGHLTIVEALGMSYRALPAGSATPGGGLALVVGAGAQMIAAGLALAAPLLVAALLAALLVGAIERAAGLSSELVPEVAVRRIAIALAAAAAVFAIGMAIAGHTRALPAALAGAIARLG